MADALQEGLLSGRQVLIVAEEEYCIMTTTSTSDSEFPFVCPGFGPINFARVDNRKNLIKIINKHLLFTTIE